MLFNIRVNVAFIVFTSDDASNLLNIEIYHKKSNWHCRQRAHEMISFSSDTVTYVSQSVIDNCTFPVMIFDKVWTSILVIGYAATEVSRIHGPERCVSLHSSLLISENEVNLKITKRISGSITLEC